MRHFVFITGFAALLALAADPAAALSITNLDKVTHRVEFLSAGTVHQREIAPNQTTRFEGLPNGTLSLLSSPNPRTGGAVNADGLLSGYIGNGRDQGIAADIMDDYVIWPGGKLGIQRRMKHYGRY